MQAFNYVYINFIWCYSVCIISILNPICATILFLTHGISHRKCCTIKKDCMWEVFNLYCIIIPSCNLSVCTQGLKTYFHTSSFFLSPFHALAISILPSKYHSQMTNPSIFQITSMTSCRYCHFALHAYLKTTHVYYSPIEKCP